MPVIEVSRLTKRFGDLVAVDGLEFSASSGEVTGFLGPNGSGKSTTLRAIVGLNLPTSGTATVNGVNYRDLAYPLRHVGAFLDPKSLPKRLRARTYLRILATSNDIARSRVEEVLDFVGIASVANKRIDEFSLGMAQRLGIAVALLGDPEVLIFDEPMNGLDPDGIRWIRQVFSSLAVEGRTVLVSSHLINEVATVAHRVVVIGRGRLLAQGTVDELTVRIDAAVAFSSHDNEGLVALVRGRGGTVTRSEENSVTVLGLDADTIGQLAMEARIVLTQLVTLRDSLEDSYFELTEQSLDFSVGH
ncbi:MAG: ATP-binding cassette domain-containing protein [Acidimicrobiaceae bacterium]|nr:ATP-binding cassette domain-containing protein [Acidimicrobiaceae bacterium]